MVVGALGIFIFGLLALIVAFVLLGFAVIILAGEVEGLRNPVPKEPAHPLRCACSGCGGDVYFGQAKCAECGRSLPGAQGSLA